MNFHSTDPDGLPAWRRDPRLFKALAASVVLHLVLLWPAAYPRPKLQLAQPLAAQLRPVAEAGVPVAAASQPAAAPSVPEVAPSSPKASTAQDRARSGRGERPRVLASAESPAPAPVPAPARPEPPDEPPAAGAAQVGTGAVASAAMGDAGSARISSASDSPAAGVDPQALVEYRFALRRSAAPRYPLLARERGWSGRVEVRVTVAEDGRPRDVSVARSAGHRLLDEEARSTIALAAARAPLPGSLRGHAFAVDVPVIFELRDSAESN
jgi:protein TonB